MRQKALFVSEDDEAIQRSAEISECGKYRWWLRRSWGMESGMTVCFIMVWQKIEIDLAEDCEICQERWFFNRDRVCPYCDYPLFEWAVTLDRIIPRSRGGSDRSSNIVACCYICNLEKADQLPLNYFMTRQPPPKWFS